MYNTLMDLGFVRTENIDSKELFRKNVAPFGVIDFVSREQGFFLKALDSNMKKIAEDKVA
jgi:hypothetical protein